MWTTKPKQNNHGRRALTRSERGPAPPVTLRELDNLSSTQGRLGGRGGCCSPPAFQRSFFSDHNWLPGPNTKFFRRHELRDALCLRRKPFGHAGANPVHYVRLARDSIQTAASLVPIKILRVVVVIVISRKPRADHQRSVIQNQWTKTDTTPCGLIRPAGLMLISTSCPRAVRNSISRPTEKYPERLRISAET